LRVYSIQSAVTMQSSVPSVLSVGFTVNDKLHGAGPTLLPEMLRVKAWLILRRNATRDYLDTVALAERLGADEAGAVVAELDSYYEDQLGAGGRRIATQLAKQLAEPTPYDLSDVDLREYRRLDERWQDWDTVARACEALAVAMLDRLSEESA